MSNHPIEVLIKLNETISYFISHFFLSKFQYPLLAAVAAAAATEAEADVALK